MKTALSRSSGSAVETVLSAESILRHPSRLFSEMGSDLLRSRELAWRLFVRDLSAQYRHSFLGFFWAFVPALTATAAVTLAKEANFIHIDTSSLSLPYPAYVLFSMTLFQAFQEALTGPIRAVAGAKAILSKLRFPREAVVLAKLLEAAFNVGIKLLVVAALFLWFRIPVNWKILLLPFALLNLVALGVAAGLFLAPLSVLFQDLVKTVTLLTTFLIFVTPVIYPVPSEGPLRVIVQFNPISTLLVGTRELAVSGTLPDPGAFFAVGLAAWAGLLIGWFFYHVAMPYVVEK